MKKFFFIILILFITTSCSMDNQSGLWNKKINELELSKTKVDDLDKNISFNEYKDIVIKYGKFSEFPNINN